MVSTATPRSAPRGLVVKFNGAFGKGPLSHSLPPCQAQAFNKE
jgi:hypothetical protein